jgi:hypothetical protein
MTQIGVSSVARLGAAFIIVAAALSLTGCRKHESSSAGTQPPGGPSPDSLASASPAGGSSAPPSVSPSDTSGLPASAAPVSMPTTPAAVAAAYASRPASLSSLSQAEFQYGISPKRGSDVTYQPDVVVMEHGADAIHGYSSNGLTWLLDANAPQVADLQPGKVMFATGRAVGRVLGITRRGNDVAVTLGPVALTEVVSDAQMSFEQPLDVSGALTYASPDFPDTASLAPLAKDTGGAKTSDSHTGDGDETDDNMISPFARVTAVSWRLRRTVDVVPGVWLAPRVAGAQGGPLRQALTLIGPLVGAPGAINIDDFKVTPFISNGMGVHIAKSTPDMMIVATGALIFKSPSLKFNLDIKNGAIKTAQVALLGVAGLRIDFEAGTVPGLSGNINKVFYVPIDFTIPIIGKTVPVAVTFRQTFILRTAFTAKNSTVSAGGDYAFTGAVSMGLQDGAWTVSAPTSFTVQKSLPNSVTGHSLGAISIIFGYGTKVIVGIGAFGFVTGPYLGYDTQAAAVRQGEVTLGLAPILCHGAVLDVGMKVGVGYSLPQPLTSAINSILRALNVKAISGFGGVAHEETLIHKAESIPTNCTGVS